MILRNIIFGFEQICYPDGGFKQFSNLKMTTFDLILTKNMKSKTGPGHK